MSRSHQFEQSLIQIIKHNKDGSFKTQADRAKSLKHSVNTLYAAGYQLEHVKYIKQRHIKYLVDQWLNIEGLSAGSMKNRMCHLRWLMEKLNKPNLIPSNDELKIPKQ